MCLAPYFRKLLFVRTVFPMLRAMLVLIDSGCDATSA